MEPKELYTIATQTIRYQQLEHKGDCGQVACCLETIDGNIYTGINIDLACSLGFCAEQAAMADMLKHGETRIKRLIAVYKNGNILPPCSRCREFMLQVNQENQEAQIILPDFKMSPLKDLIPHPWEKYENAN